jgi:hypothetical protein
MAGRMTSETSLKKSAYWVIFITLLALAGYAGYRFLSSQIFGLMLWQKLIEDPDHRWKPHERNDINSDGLRSSREAIDFHTEDFNIIFAGDSYTFGHLLSAEQSPPMQFEKITREKFPDKPIKVINFGWSSSSPYLSLRLLKDKGFGYKPDLVIFLLDATDFKDDFFYRNVIEKRGAYKFIVEYPLLSHFPRQIARKTDGFTHWQEKWLGYPDYSNYFLFHQPYEKSLPFFDNTYDILKQINDYVTQELKAKFIVFVPPRHWQYTDKESLRSWERHNYVAMSEYVLNNYRYWDEKSSESPFPIVSLLEDFKSTDIFPTTFEKDSHWNPEGAKLAAELILNHCGALNCFKE